jgi:hypothetical protein
VPVTLNKTTYERTLMNMAVKRKQLRRKGRLTMKM